MNVEAAVLGSVDEAWGDEKPERDGDDQIDGVAIWLGHLVICQHRRVYTGWV